MATLIVFPSFSVLLGLTSGVPVDARGDGRSRTVVVRQDYARLVAAQLDLWRHGRAHGRNLLVRADCAICFPMDDEQAALDQCAARRAQDRRHLKSSTYVKKFS